MLAQLTLDSLYSPKRNLMAEIEITQEDSSQVSIEVDEPQVNSVAREAARINTLADANSGADPRVRIQKPEYDPIGDFIESARQRRPEQMLQNREYAVAGNFPTVGSDEEIKQYQEDMDGSNGLLGFYRQKALEISQGGSKDIDELAFSMMYRVELANQLGDFELLSGEGAATLGGTLIPMRETHNIAQVAQSLGFTEDLLDVSKAYADPGGTLEEMRRVALSLKPEDRAKMFEAALESLSDLDNKLIKQQILTSIFSGDFDKDWTNVFNALDAADIATLGLGTGKLLRSFTKAGSMANIARRAPTPESVAFVKDVANNPETARLAGVSPAQVSDMYNPVMHGELGADMTGIPDDLASEIALMTELQDSRMAALRVNSLREGVMTDQRKNEVMALAEEELRKEKWVQGLRLESTDTGFTMFYDELEYAPESIHGFTLKSKEKHVDFLTDNQGNVEVDLDSEFVNSWVRMDPNAKLKGRVNQELVSTAETITREQGKVIGTLERMLKDAYKPLSKSEAAKLDKLLMKGSKEQKEYSYKELKGMGYDDKMVKAYFGQRNVSRHLYELEDQKIRDGLISEGVKILNLGDAEVPARSFESADEAYNAYRSFDSDSYSVMVLDEGFEGIPAGQRLDFDSMSAFNKEFIQKAYDRGFVLSRNYSPANRFKVGDNVTEWALSRPDRVVHPRGRRVLNYIPGYVPKSRTNSFYFVKSSVEAPISNPKKSLDGKPRMTETTVAWADNIKDAEAFAARLGGKEKGYRVAFDRELSPEVRSTDMIQVRGGLFGGKRKATELPFVGTGDRLQDEGSLEMMQRYINHLGRQVPSHLWRIGNEQRVIERAKRIMPDAPIRNIRDVLPQAQERLTKGSKEYNYLKTQVEQIQNVSAIPTDDELEMAKRFENIGNSLEGVKGLEWLAKYFYRASQRKLNVADKIRGVTFTHMLGMYNPAQFLVQASGAIVSFAVNPVAAVKAMPKMIGWQMLDGFLTSPLDQKRAADWLRSQGLAEYADSYLIWAKSGFREAITDSNSDMATLFGKKPYDAGVLQRLMSNNTLFYEMGELAMSRASVATAIEWYKDVNKISKVDINDANALKTIYERAEKYRLNMGRANRSSLNTGWKAVPLQFQQVISKYYEKVLPSNLGGTTEFNKWEKIRLAAIPTAMMGAASVPGATFLFETAANTLGVDLASLSPEEVEMFQGGVVGWALTEGLDANVDFTSRMSLGSDIFERMYQFAAGGGGNLMATVMGPSGNVATRYTQAAQYIWKAVDLTTEMETFSAQEAELVSKVIGDALFSLPSGSRNIRDYMPHIIADNPAFIKDGRYLWDWEEMNTQTALLAAFGFQPQEQVALYELSNKLRDSTRADALKWLESDKHVIANILSTGILGSSSEEEMEIKSKVIGAIIRAYEPREREKLLKDVYNVMYSPSMDQDDMFNKFRLENVGRMQDGLNFINKVVSSKTQQMNGN